MHNPLDARVRVQGESRLEELEATARLDEAVTN